MVRFAKRHWNSGSNRKQRPVDGFYFTPKRKKLNAMKENV